MMIRFIVPGEPQGKARARVVRKRGGKGVTSYTPNKTTDYEALVRWEFIRVNHLKHFSENQTGAVSIQIFAYFSIPKSAKKTLPGSPCCKKPDADNILKIICDALNGVAYHDDSQIVHAEVSKFWSDVSRVEVEIVA